MARGTKEKEDIKNKILSVFDGSFIAADGKTIRVPLTASDGPIEIKISLVAANDLEGGNGVTPTSNVGATTSAFPEPLKKLTDEEVSNVEALMAKLF